MNRTNSCDWHKKIRWIGPIAFIILKETFALPEFFLTGWNCSLRADLSNSFSECIHQHFHVSVGSSNTYTKYILYQQTAPQMMKIDDLPEGKDFNWQLLICLGQICFEIFFFLFIQEKNRDICRLFNYLHIKIRVWQLRLKIQFRFHTTLNCFQNVEMEMLASYLPSSESNRTSTSIEYAM